MSGKLRRMRAWELAACIVLVSLAAMVILPALSRSREAARRASCQNNLKQMGLVVRMFANESKGGYLPPLSSIPNNWMMDMDTVMPDYLTDPSIFICPNSSYRSPDVFTFRGTADQRKAETHAIQPDCVSSLFYIYTGYAISSDEQALALFDAYYRSPSALLQRAEIVAPVPVWEESGARAQNAGEIPIIWDRPFLDASAFSHSPPGGNVLYLDGHVAFLRYGYYNASSCFPMTRVSAETFGSTFPLLRSDCVAF